MFKVGGTVTEQQIENWMGEMCNELLQAWLVDLSYKEKVIWLWNASVAMAKIKRRREI